MSALPAAVDVVVVGSGAAGLVAAIRAASVGRSTLVLEAGAELGGTTALSGGRVWIPANGTEANAGDSEEAARTYLRQIFDPRYPEFVDALVDDANRMRSFVEQHTPHRFVVCPNYPDYHPELDGATIGGRCFDMEVLSLPALVPEASRVREAPGYVPIRHAEWEAARYPGQIDADALRRRYDEGGRTGGVALAAALVDGAVRAGATLATSARLVRVEQDADGTVVAAIVAVDGDERRVATRAVVLATGGYDGDADRMRAMMPAGLSVSAAVPSSTGVALDVAAAVGADVDNLHEGWWMPMALVPGDEVDGRPYPKGLVRERGVPRSIIVNEAGSRFIDEASPYNEFGKAMHVVDASGATPNRVAWLVFDEGFRRRYPFPGLAASGALPEHVVGAPSIAALASAIGVDGDGLAATVERWNAMSAAGVDDELERGGNPYDRYYGDPWQDGAPNLGPIDEAPFYATRILSGSIGSRGGPVTDVHARMLADGVPIRGLYAAGNAAAFWTGDGYPGPGATLAVAMVMGLRAGDALDADLG